MNSKKHSQIMLKTYPHWFYIPAGIIFSIFFVLPTILAFYFSLTRWTLFDATFIGLKNYQTFLSNPMMVTSLKNTIIYAVITSGSKVVLALLLAVLFTSSAVKLKTIHRSIVFFPTLISTVAVGITFSALMQPSYGLINNVFGLFGLTGPDWLGNPDLALYSVALVDIWRGIGIALIIYIAGIISISDQLLDAARLEGGAWVKFRHVILPLSRNSMFTVILLSFIGGLRTFDLIWSMTHGGPGFSSDVLTSVIFKQYGAGFYGLSTAGNVVLFLMVTLIAYPMMSFFNRKELDL